MRQKHFQNDNYMLLCILGTMAPSPLIKMNLYLVKASIVYIPNRYELMDTFTTILDEIVHIMSTIPRLFEKFALPAGGLKKFYEAIQVDPDCNKLQAYIDEGNMSTYPVVQYPILNL